MRLLVDNTLIHRIGTVLAADGTRAIRSVDALGILHFAEHILYSERILVSSHEQLGTFERTAGLVSLLHREGLARSETGSDLMGIVAISEDAYDGACSRAAWRVLDELTGLNSRDLKCLGRVADTATRPEGVAVPPFNNWVSPQYPFRDDEERVAELRAARAEGSFELMLIRCPPLRQRLSNLRRECGRLTTSQSAALSALFRIYVNEELARDQTAVHSPAPQRVRVATQTHAIFRHQLARVVQSVAKERLRTNPSKVLAELETLDHLPLPLFALYALRNATIRSPWDLLAAAQRARNEPNIVAVRKWLTLWELKNASTDERERGAALVELGRMKEDLLSSFSGDRHAILASLRLGGSFELDQYTGNPTWSPPSPSVADLCELLARRLNKQRRFLAAVTLSYATDRALGAKVLRFLNGYVK